MKPWLFDILACPIDKFFPLKLHIFSFETKPKELSSFIEIYENRDLDLIKKEKIVKEFQQGEKLLIQDNIIIEQTELKDYLNLIILSINEIDNIFDRTQSTQSKNCFKIIQSIIKPKILEFLARHASFFAPQLRFFGKPSYIADQGDLQLL